MKKMILSLMLAAAACTATYASNACDNDNVTTVTRKVSRKMQEAPAGTTYGVTGKKGGDIEVSTPLGKYTIRQQADGTYSFMGVKARLVSVRKGVYTVETSLGTWAIDTCRGTVTKK